MTTTVAATLVALGLAVVTATSAQADPGAHDRADTQGLVAEIRRSLNPYREVSVALAAGYVQTSPGCVETEAGGLGIHYTNFAVVAAGEIDPTQPQTLIYGPEGDGGLSLLGALWWQADAGQDRPHLGGEPFLGPMPGHAPWQPAHYDLFVWTHLANPSGVFAVANPLASC